MADVVVGREWGPLAGQIAAWIVAGVIAFLLLPAVNIAIVALIAISFLMSRDILVCEGKGVGAHNATGICHQRLRGRYDRRYRGNRRRFLFDSRRTPEKHAC